MKAYCTSRSQRGFTLVELVVVILILGILAGVAAPKLFDTSKHATENGLKQSLAIIRDAIELYAANNGGALPGCTGVGADFKLALDPYVRGDFPTCPVAPNKNNNVGPGTASPLAYESGQSTGWLYDTTTGEFVCNSDGTASDGTAYDEL